MCQNQCIPTIYFRLHSRHIIPNRIAFALEVMMLTRHPFRLIAWVFNVFIFVEFPYYITIPIDLNQIFLILPAVCAVSFTAGTKNLSTRQHFVWKALQISPMVYYASVHVNQRSTMSRSRKQSIPVKTFFRLIDNCPHWMY